MRFVFGENVFMNENLKKRNEIAVMNEGLIRGTNI